MEGTCFALGSTSIVDRSALMTDCGETDHGRLLIALICPTAADLAGAGVINTDDGDEKHFFFGI